MRMSSSRLPGKVLMKLNGKTILEHIIYRIKLIKNIKNVIICTSIEKSDDVLYEKCKDLNILCFRGSLNNVLERFYNCCLENNITHICRICGDSPLIDPFVIDKIADFYINNNYDYVTQIGLPIGIASCEFFTFNSLEIAYFNVHNNNKYINLKSSYQEHVTTFIKENQELFNSMIINMKLLNKTKLYNEHTQYFYIDTSIDTHEDFFNIENIFNYYDHNKLILLHDIISFYCMNNVVNKNIHIDHMSNILQNAILNNKCTYMYI